MLLLLKALRLGILILIILITSMTSSDQLAGSMAHSA